MSQQAFKSTRNISRETKKADRIIVSGLDYGDVNFPFSKKDYGRIEKKASALMCFVVKIIWFIMFMYQMKNLEITCSYCS